MSAQFTFNTQFFWPRSKRLIQATAILVIVTGPIAVVRSLILANSRDLRQQVRALNEQVEDLKQQQSMPGVVLNRYRNSVCYVFGIYSVGFAHEHPMLRTRISGSGFLVAPDLIATNRHVAEPWYGDADSERMIAKGATASLEKLVAYFPGSQVPVDLGSKVVSQDVDLAVVRIAGKANLDVLPAPLSPEKPRPGEPVSVIGYPLGVLGMAAKSPNSVDASLASKRDVQDEAARLAAWSLIRPSATFGHIGDVIGPKVIYDAPTAHGASGGPVFNSRGEVVAVNAGFIDGFPGGTFGVSSALLKPLIEEAQKRIAGTSSGQRVAF